VCTRGGPGLWFYALGTCIPWTLGKKRPTPSNPIYRRHFQFSPRKKPEESLSPRYFGLGNFFAGSVQDAGTISAWSRCANLVFGKKSSLKDEGIGESERRFAQKRRSSSRDRGKKTKGEKRNLRGEMCAILVNEKTLGPGREKAGPSVRQY